MVAWFTLFMALCFAGLLAGEAAPAGFCGELGVSGAGLGIADTAGGMALTA